MPVSQMINPQVLGKNDVLRVPKIPLCTYQKRLKDVRDEFSEADLVDMYRDKQVIREFEHMVKGIRTVKEYNGVEYSYTGPAHLSIGQEASAVGQAYVLDLKDYSFGTHRSHGEVLARGLIAIRRLSEGELLEIMEGFRGGALLRSVETFGTSKGLGFGEIIAVIVDTKIVPLHNILQIRRSRRTIGSLREGRGLALASRYQTDQQQQKKRHSKACQRTGKAGAVYPRS